MVTGHKRPSKHIKNFVDIFLKPLLPRINSYVKGDFDFLKKCNRNLTKKLKTSILWCSKFINQYTK